ncbi:MAG: Lrp/AsnC ligand binding domain-containing protein [Cellvibrionaceae bacterium]|nr:Lrp/AsnC ligand binding domain-containing protein [Cellvibrionaceae bacterium]
MQNLDKIDRNILKVLQKNGRVTYADIARQVGLSTTPCLERVKKMEKQGVIRGYTTIVNPEYLKANLVVFINIRLSKQEQDVFAKFKAAVLKLTTVQECYLVSGNFDYLLKARVKDMSSYRKFYAETVLKLPGVIECTSHVVMEEVKDTMEIHTEAGF